MDQKPDIHIPSPSYWPIVLAASLALIAAGLVSSAFISIFGVIVLLVAVAGWTLENRAAGEEHPHE